MKKQSIFKRIISRLDVRKWRKKSQIVLCVVMAIILACGVLAFLNPSEEKLRASASDELKASIERGDDVRVAYDSLGIVSQCSFSVNRKVIERYVGFAGVSFEANDGAGKAVGRLINFTCKMLGIGDGMFVGIKLTLILTFTSVLTGLVLAVFLALGKISKNKIISKICSGYIFFFRGTPLLIQLMFLYFGLPTLLNSFGLEFAWTKIGRIFVDYTEAKDIGSLLASFIAFSLNSAAYCAEIVRAAILSIDKGQHEAAKALGMSYGQTMSKVIIPQSIGRLIPPFANEFVLVLKDASLVFALGLQDITTISNNLHNDYASSLAYVPALVIYLILTAVLTAIFNKLEKKFSSYL